MSSGTIGPGIPATRSLPRHGECEVEFSRIARFIESQLDWPDLSPETICARSVWSRATLYRLFEPHGGLSRYIRQLRLQRAYAELSQGGRHRRILDIALDSQFASEATFSRAFRRTFGMPPSEARTLALRPGSLTAAPSGAQHCPARR